MNYYFPVRLPRLEITVDKRPLSPKMHSGSLLEALLPIPQPQFDAVRLLLLVHGPTLIFRMAQRCSIGFRSSEFGGHSDLGTKATPCLAKTPYFRREVKWGRILHYKPLPAFEYCIGHFRKYVTHDISIQATIH